MATAAARYEDYLAMYAKMSTDERRKQGDREKLAQSQKAALGPHVPELTLPLTPGAPGETAAVKRDGIEIAGAMLGVALPVDPEEHLVTTQVPGGEVTEIRVTLGLVGPALRASGSVDGAGPENVWMAFVGHSPNVYAAA